MAPATTGVLVQPSPPPADNASTRAPRTTKDSTAPTKSNGSRGSSDRGDRRRSTIAQTSPTAPVGTLNQNTARQPSVVASSGPTTWAADAIVTLSPGPRLRSSGGNAS